MSLGCHASLATLTGDANTQHFEHKSRQLYKLSTASNLLRPVVTDSSQFKQVRMLFKSLTSSTLEAAKICKCYSRRVAHRFSRMQYIAATCPTSRCRKHTRRAQAVK
jgi:hypothetical protein